MPNTPRSGLAFGELRQASLRAQEPDNSLEMSLAEGLLQHGRVWVRRVGTRSAVAGYERERNASLTQRLCDRIGGNASEVEVEERQIERPASRQLNRLVQFARRGDNVTAKARQHVLDQHGDHCLVLDEEHARPGLRLFGHARINPTARRSHTRRR
jgi:hypothetical protein